MHLQNKINSLIEKQIIDKNSALYFIDDGSTDETCEILLQAKNGTAHKVIKLSKNYGQQNAILAGLKVAYKMRFCCAISIDGDLQQDIDAMDLMIEKFMRGNEVVFGVRKAYTNEKARKKYTSFAFYRFMRALGVNIIPNHIEYRLLSHKAIKSLLNFREVNLFLRGIVPLLGFKSEIVYYKQMARAAGDSKYPFVKLFSLALDGITSFSIAPLRIMSVFGVILFALCGIYGAYAIYVKFFTATPLAGWTSMIMVLLFFGGMQFLGLGIIGEYIGKIYKEVKRRPIYIIDEIL
ncbi:glycosyltransferase [Helicobacter sp. 23-1044]